MYEVTAIITVLGLICLWLLKKSSNKLGLTTKQFILDNPDVNSIASVYQYDDGFKIVWQKGGFSFVPHGHKNVKLVHQWSMRDGNTIQSGETFK